jgi:hypothetical protein
MRQKVLKSMRYHSLFRTWLIGVLSFASVAAHAYQPPPFPRIGGYLIGDPHAYDDPTYQAQIARLSVAILNIWPGYAGASGTSSMPQNVKAIKSLNSNTLIFLYNNINELQLSDTAFTDVLTALNQNDWWLHPGGGSTALVSSVYGPSYFTTNTTTFTPMNSSGQRYIDWRANWNVQQFYTPDQAIDGFYTDNVNVIPTVTGDWNRDGTPDAPASAQTWFRQGFAAYFNDLKAAMPGKYQLGNIAMWGDPNAVLTEYNGLLNGGVLEYMIGASWSVETWGGWQALLNWYRKSIGATAAPKLVIFEQIGNPTDYQSMRYGLSTCLMDDAYYEFSPNDDGHTVAWFDEYNSNLGNPVGSQPTAAWQNGVWRRDFANGIALVNPKGNGVKTVTLETQFKKIAGTQAPAVNDGTTVQTVTLQDRDGVILLRLQPVSKVPKSPGGLTLSN